MNQPRPLPLPTDPGDGCEVSFCSTCAFSDACSESGVTKVSLEELHCLVQHVGPFHQGHIVFRTNDAFNSIYAVRAGVIKTCVTDEQGREQILGFHLPGELIGLNAIYPDRYPCDAITLDTATLCRFSFGAMASLATRVPKLQERLFRLMSKDISASYLLTGDFSADERLAAFICDLSARYAARGYSARRLHLSMPRSDIANYLCLAPETVSRVLRRFQEEALIEVDRRELTIHDHDRLAALARPLLRDQGQAASR